MTLGQAAQLMIGTPASGGTVHLGFVSTLLGLRAAGVAFTLVDARHERATARARNALVATFHARRSFTHLLFLYADLGLAAGSIERMLSHARDAVAAPVPLEVADARDERRFDIGQAVGETGPLVIVDAVGAGALLLSRRAVDALVGDATSDGRVYEGPPGAGDAAARVHYDVFRAGAFDGAYRSEDPFASARLRRLGFAIHVDPAIVVSRREPTVT